MATPVQIDGKTYPSKAAAAEALGISRQAVQQRCAAGSAKALATGDPGGRPRKPAADLAADEKGNRRVKVKYTEAQLKRFDRYLKRFESTLGGRMSRETLIAKASLLGLAEMERGA